MQRILLIVLTFVATLYGTALAQAAGSEDAHALSNDGCHKEVTIHVAALSVGHSLEAAQFTSYLADNTNVNIEWTELVGDVESEISLMDTSDDWPDLLVTQYMLSKNRVWEYASEGDFIPLNDYIGTCAPHIQRALESPEGTEFRDRLTMEDGRIYSFPYIFSCPGCEYPLMMWIYVPWMRTLGVPIPETTEELELTLYDIKHSDSNGNGKPDEIPLIGTFAQGPTNPLGFLMNSFVFTQLTGPGAFLARQGTQVEFVANTDEWREGLRYIKRLYESGHLKIVENLENMRQDIEKGLVGVFAAHRHFLLAPDRFADYGPVSPLEGPAKQQQTPVVPRPMWYTSHITEKDNAAPITTIIDWWFQDSVAHNYLCEAFWWEDVDWKYATANEQKEWDWLKVAYDSPPVKTILIGETGAGNLNYENGWRTSCFTRWEPYSFESLPAFIVTESEKWKGIMEATRLMAPHAVRSLPAEVSILPEAEEKYEEVITAVVLERSLQFVRGERDLDNDNDWESYKDELRGLGVDQYVDIWQEAVDNKPEFEGFGSVDIVSG